MRRIHLRSLVGTLALTALLVATGLTVSTTRARTVTGAGASAPAFASPLTGFSLGADLSPINLLPDQTGSPTGPALISLLQADHIRLLRVMAHPAASMTGLASELARGGWRTLFDELDRAHIGAVLLIGGQAGPTGSFAWGQSPLEPPNGTGLVSGQKVESTAQWIANEAATLGEIKIQCGGRLPPALVGIEVANEPLVDAATLPALAQVVAAVRREAPGIPVSIGGWRVPPREPGQLWDWNDPLDAAKVAPLVDFVSAHLYPDKFALLPGGGANRTSTDPATYETSIGAFLTQVIAAAGRKPVMVGEFGSLDGRPETVPYEPSGGSMSHQAVVVKAVIDAMVAARAHHRVTGGTLYAIEEPAGPGYSCTPWELICFGRPVTPALATLVSAASTYDR